MSPSFYMYFFSFPSLFLFLSFCLSVFLSFFCRGGLTVGSSRKNDVILARPALSPKPGNKASNATPRRKHEKIGNGKREGGQAGFAGINDSSRPGAEAEMRSGSGDLSEKKNNRGNEVGVRGGGGIKEDAAL